MPLTQLHQVRTLMKNTVVQTVLLDQSKREYNCNEHLCFMLMHKFYRIISRCKKYLMKICHDTGNNNMIAF